ncbi:MAG: AI-2E family transporter [Acidimicrobiia bacterium]
MPPSWTAPTKRLAVVGMLLVGLFVVYLARGILTPVVLAALLALILSPIIGSLRRRLRLPRGAAVAVVYLVFVGAMVAIPILFVPALGRSAAALDLPAIIDELSAWAVGTLESLRAFSLFGYEVDLRSSVDPLIETLTSGGEGMEVDLGRVFGGAWAVTAAVFSGAVAFVTSTILALVLSIYIASAMGRERSSGWYELVPAPFVPEARILGARVSRVWTAYLRGQLTVAVVVGILTTIVLYALGTPGALVLGVIGGVFNIIPTFGPIFAGVVAALVALVQGSDRFDVSNVVFALIVLGAYVVLQQLESNLIAPRILGDAMAVSPLAILIGILVGFSGAGVLGAVVAVPVVATAREIFLYVRSKLVEEDPYPDGPPQPRRTFKDRWEEISPSSPDPEEDSEGDADGEE